MNTTKLKYKTNFLLPKNDFLVGLGSVLNIKGDYFQYNYSKTEIEADSKAIYSDWVNVGRDLKEAKKKFELKNKIDSNIQK